MAYTNPTWLEGRRKYWTRPDAYRFASPGSPEAKMPGYLHPWAAVARAEEAAEDEARARAAAEQEDHERALLELRWLVKSIRTDLALRRLRHKYSPAQPRVPAGIPEGGQWTSGGGGNDLPGGNDQSLEQLSGPTGSSSALDRRSFLAPGPGQEPRADLLDLDAIARHPNIRARIDEAWAASDPNSFGREQGFWISRNDATGELFTRPFANEGGPARIIPGAPPSDAIATFHTHPARPEFGGDPTPSPYDRLYATRIGLPGLLQSHSGMYYFGPLLRPRRLP